jgi:hypothetical protein
MSKEFFTMQHNFYLMPERQTMFLLLLAMQDLDIDGDTIAKQTAKISQICWQIGLSIHNDSRNRKLYPRNERT